MISVSVILKEAIEFRRLIVKLCDTVTGVTSIRLSGRLSFLKNRKIALKKEYFSFAPLWWGFTVYILIL